MNGSFLAAFLYRSFLVIAFFALFLTFVGPMLDHHVAERHPYHTHIYLSSSATEHVHFYEEADTHVHQRGDANSHPSTLPSDSSGDADVVYLTPSDGLGQSVTSLVVTGLHTDLVYPAPDNNHFLLGFGGGDGLPPEAFVTPPRRPPRA